TAVYPATARDTAINSIAMARYDFTCPMTQQPSFSPLDPIRCPPFRPTIVYHNPESIARPGIAQNPQRRGRFVLFLLPLRPLLTTGSTIFQNSAASPA